MATYALTEKAVVLRSEDDVASGVGEEEFAPWIIGPVM
jgi:hypothetical protein